MLLALGMLAYEDAFLLPRILPILRPHFDRFVVGYTPSTDGTLDILARYSPIIENIEKSYDWASMRNRVIKIAEDEGCTHILFVDSDECFLQSDLPLLRSELEANGKALATMYPRWEFVDDFNHFDPSLAPDFQARGFMLNEGYTYTKKTHEQLMYRGALCYQNGLCFASKLPIFHYGKVKDSRYVALKYIGYDALLAGKDPPQELPEGYQIPESWGFGRKKKFEGEKPL